MEARNSKSSRFQIHELEERIAPAGVSQALGNGDQVTGSVDITVTPGSGGASGTISVETPGTTVNIEIGTGPV